MFVDDRVNSIFDFLVSNEVEIGVYFFPFDLCFSVVYEGEEYFLHLVRSRGDMDVFINGRDSVVVGRFLDVDGVLVVYKCLSIVIFRSLFPVDVVDVHFDVYNVLVEYLQDNLVSKLS